MPARKGKKGGKRGYFYHGRFYTLKQWGAKWATHGFKRKPRKRR